MTAIAVLLVLGGIAALGWLIWEAVRAPQQPAHARLAAALLQPDHPDLPDTPFADQVEADLRAYTTQEMP